MLANQSHIGTTLPVNISTSAFLTFQLCLGIALAPNALAAPSEPNTTKPSIHKPQATLIAANSYALSHDQAHKKTSPTWPSVEHVQTLTEQVSQTLGPTIGAPITLKTTQMPTQSMFFMATNPTGCTLIINTHPSAWAQWQPLLNPLGAKTSTRLTEALIKTIVAHEIGHCADAHADKPPLKTPQANLPNGSVGTIDQLFIQASTPLTLRYQQHKQKSSLAQELYADTFALAYQQQTMPAPLAQLATERFLTWRQAAKADDPDHATYPALVGIAKSLRNHSGVFENQPLWQIADQLMPHGLIPLPNLQTVQAKLSERHTNQALNPNTHKHLKASKIINH